MPRKKPTSQKAKKADQKLKRSIKRGDVEPSPVSNKPAHGKRRRVGPTGRNLDPQAAKQDAAIDSARRLQSSFLKLPPKFLEVTKSLAASLVLDRPIQPDVAVFHRDQEISEITEPLLSCPRRPKWNFDMTKKMVEANEEGLFNKWIQETDNIIERWQRSADTIPPQTTDDTDNVSESLQRMPRSNTYFERNIEVWRQLWRVTEISQILLVLLDSRCPILHYPPSLARYLGDRKVILVLTKSDIVGPARTSAWIAYFKQCYPNVRIVQVQSYVEKEESASHQGRKMYEPHIPMDFRTRLVEEIKAVHAELREPLENVRNNERRLKEWVSPVKKEVDWDSVISASGNKVGTAVGGATVPRVQESAEDDVVPAEHPATEPDMLTVGLIGQPNVGKSSLLNALFGSSKVRASRTPGKTKHFQTLFWTSEVRLVDCPGLVMPNFVPLEMQILAGIFPISRVSAIPSSIHHSTCLLPLEEICNLKHPDTSVTPAEDKRTWRDGVKKEKEKDKLVKWTAMDILTAYANRKAWVTAKAGRSDVNRAGNALLRALAEGRISWAFWPPDTDASLLESGPGIWIHDRAVEEEEDDVKSDEQSEDGRDQDDSSEEEDDEELGSEEDSEEEGGVAGNTTGRFAALGFGGSGDESDDSVDEE